MAERLTNFRKMRTRIHDLSTGQWHAGWAGHVAQDQARIRLQSPAAIRAGGQVILECYGDGTIVRFSGTIVAQRELDIAIDVYGSLSFVPSNESVRITVDGVTGSLTGPDGRWPFLVADASPDSLGVYVTQSVPPDSTFDFRVGLPLGPVEGVAQTVYCRECPDVPGQYRVGMRITEMKRLESALWIRFLHDSTAS